MQYIDLLHCTAYVRRFIAIHVCQENTTVAAWAPRDGNDSLVYTLNLLLSRGSLGPETAVNLEMCNWEANVTSIRLGNPDISPSRSGAPWLLANRETPELFAHACDTVIQEHVQMTKKNVHVNSALSASKNVHIATPPNMQVAITIKITENAQVPTLI